MAKATKPERLKMGDLIKQLPTPQTPIQEVRPVVQKPVSGPEARINFNVPADYAKKLKIDATNLGMSMKELLLTAYEQYMDKVNK